MVGSVPATPYPRRMTSRRSRIATATIAGLAAAALLGACAAPGSTWPGSTRPTGAPTAGPETPGTEGATTASAQQQLDFPEVYAQQLDWHFCGPDEATAAQLEATLRSIGARAEGISCTAVEVPLDWNDPANPETILLSAVLVPSTGEGERLGTLFSNPGGPGASGIDFAIGMTASPGYAELQQHYDLLGFDPRGMGTSSPLDCAPTSTIFELQLAECAEQDPLTASMGSAQVARDLELLRHLVGDKQLHYAGFSYGTVIGASYVTLFPERVGRVMLDSAWPSDWSGPLDTYLQAEAIAGALGDLVAECGTRYEVAVCPIAPGTTVAEGLARLAAAPLTASDGTTVDHQMLRGYLTTALYQLKTGRERILDIAGRAVTGDQSAVDELAAAMAGGGSKVQLSGMVVRCLSMPRDPRLLDLDRYIREHGLPELLGGPEITDQTLRQFLDLSCDALPDSGEDFLHFTNASGEPVLVFGITGDHATPYAGAQRLVDELGDAQLVTLEGNGHIASFNGRSSCADAIANAYLIRGELPAEGTVCTDD